jgi:CrcB protein
VLVSILAGGFLGTLARYEVGLAWPTPNGHFPTATFVINTSGAFLLGLLLAILLERRRPTRYLRPFAATGVLGGWTTYSSLVVEATTLGKGGDVALAGGYLALTLVCGVIAVTLGIALGRSRMSTPGPEPGPAAAHAWEVGR